MRYRSYRLRGTPDSPIAVYCNSERFHPIVHWHPEIELILILTGSLTCRLEDQKITLHTGDIFIFNPNQLHDISSCSEDYQFINIIFSLEAIAMDDAHIFQRNFVAPLADGRLQLPNILRSDHPAHAAVASAIVMWQMTKL